MEIKILGTGCSKCDKLEKNLKKALKESDIDATIEKVEELKEIVRYGVMTTPALVINDKVVSVGKVLSAKEIKKFLWWIRWVLSKKILKTKCPSQDIYYPRPGHLLFQL